MIGRGGMALPYHPPAQQQRQNVSSKKRIHILDKELEGLAQKIGIKFNKNNDKDDDVTL